MKSQRFPFSEKGEGNIFSVGLAFGILALCVISMFTFVPSKLQGSEEDRREKIIENNPAAENYSREDWVFTLYGDGCFTFEPKVPERFDTGAIMLLMGQQWYDNPQTDMPENARVVCPNEIQQRNDILAGRYYEIRSTLQFEYPSDMTCNWMQNMQVPSDVFAYKDEIDTYYKTWGINAMARLVSDWYNGLIEDTTLAPTASGLYRGMYFFVRCFNDTKYVDYQIYNYHTNDGTNAIQYATALVIDNLNFINKP